MGREMEHPRSAHFPPSLSSPRHKGWLLLTALKCTLVLRMLRMLRGWVCCSDNHLHVHPAVLLLCLAREKAGVQQLCFPGLAFQLNTPLWKASGDTRLVSEQ